MIYGILWLLCGVVSLWIILAISERIKFANCSIDRTKNELNVNSL